MNSCKAGARAGDEDLLLTGRNTRTSLYTPSPRLFVRPGPPTGQRHYLDSLPT